MLAALLLHVCDMFTVNSDLNDIKYLKIDMSKHFCYK